MYPVALLPAIDRLYWIFGALRAAVWARVRAPGMGEPLMNLIWRRISRVETRVRALVAQLAAGTLRPARVRPCGRSAERSMRQPGAQSGAAAGSAPTLRLPRRFGWLLPLVPHVAATYAGQVQGLLADPEMVAMIEAAPGLTRAFQPLCHMLGVDFGRRKAAARRARPGREATVPSAEGDAAPGLEERGDRQQRWAAWPNGVPADVWLRFPDSHWLSPEEQDGSGGGGTAEDPVGKPVEAGAAGVRRWA